MSPKDFLRISLDLILNRCTLVGCYSHGCCQVFRHFCQDLCVFASWQKWREINSCQKVGKSFGKPVAWGRSARVGISTDWSAHPFLNLSMANQLNPSQCLLPTRLTHCDDLTAPQAPLFGAHHSSVEGWIDYLLWMIFIGRGSWSTLI